MASASFDATIGAIYGAAADPTTWSAAMERVSRHVGGFAALISYHDFETNSASIVAGGIRDDLCATYVEHHIHNPYSAGMLHARPGIAKLGREFIDPASLGRTAFHADVLAPQQIADQVMIGHASFTTPSSSGGFAIMLGKDADDDLQVALRRLERLGFHLSAALDLAQVVERVPARQRHLAAILDAMPLASLVVDRRCRIEALNAAAEALLRSGNGLIMRSGRTLAANGRGAAGALARLVAVTASPDAAPATLRVDRPSGPPLLIKAARLPPIPFDAWFLPDKHGSLLLQVVDPLERIPDGIGHTLRRLFGLTPAEARVALLIGSGQSAPEAAAALSLSVNTVRTHLAHCFEKLDVRSQVALSWLISGLSLLD